MCPAFPPTCPRGHVAIVNGCPICTGTCTIVFSCNRLSPCYVFFRFIRSCSITVLIYVHVLVIVAHLTTTQQTTTAQAQLTCAPVRCTAPCNKGIMLGADGCPACVCWTLLYICIVLYICVVAWQNLFSSKDGFDVCLLMH